VNISTKKAQLEKQMAELGKELKSIEKSAAFRKENLVKRSLSNLIKKHGCSKSDLIALLQSDDDKASKRGRPAAKSTKSRKPRKLKVFKNPNTGETVETRGGNHKILKAWKAEYNLTNIDDWLVGTED
jgi:DNA-binding protein H-NS